MCIVLFTDLTQSQMLCRGVSTHKVGGFRGHTPRISFTNKDEPEPHETRRKSASSRLGSSPRPSIASDDRADGMVLRYVRSLLGLQLFISGIDVSQGYLLEPQLFISGIDVSQGCLLGQFSIMYVTMFY
ncbi:unnamed protein product [Diatraea saccharalis]|uniref:Uncharacterized protein n=1 Tax=Diatraea saccharalis TaxID=40085 RepID=A0A9N9QYL8_9NEOP|nr:unnamed protein product [Diatraea saccharalis]